MGTIVLSICSHPVGLDFVAVRGEPEAKLRTPEQYQHRMDEYERGYLGSVPESWARNPNQSALREYWIRRKGELGYLGDHWQELLARM